MNLPQDSTPALRPNKRVLEESRISNTDVPSPSLQSPSPPLTPPSPFPPPALPSPPPSAPLPSPPPPTSPPLPSSSPLTPPPPSPSSPPQSSLLPPPPSIPPPGATITPILGEGRPICSATTCYAGPYLAPDHCPWKLNPVSNWQKGAANESSEAEYNDASEDNTDTE
ncbi:hypothetical protein DFH11DRAFT_1587513 [Phellopilus nigrolimitatus]|nr:hypothetical protein DFH11DRAFT_1587513 [Phellopilus nigrolimitatus]